MNLARRAIFSLLLVLAAWAPGWTSTNAIAQTAGALPCGEKDTACAIKAIREDPLVHRIQTWSELLARPLVERVEPAPDWLVRYITLDNIANGWPERPRAAGADPRFIADVKAAIADLPPEITRLFVDKLAGVMLVENMGGTGYTDFINAPDGGQVAGYIVLDAGVLTRLSANEWATWKENSPFVAQPPLRIEAQIESGGRDNRRNAIQYILLHELGHVLAIGGNIHPPWDVDPKDVNEAMAYPFFELSWAIDKAKDRYVSRFDAQFTQRPNVSYYINAKLPAADMQAVYTNLARTNFPSLYAATRPGDDFAESFASYVHVVLMQRPWEIRVMRADEPVTVFKACWDEERCRAKREMLESVIKRW